MKLIFSVNAYKPFSELTENQKFCVKSLQNLKTKHENFQIELVTLCFKHNEIEYPGFDDCLVLNETSRDYVAESLTQLPMSLDIFNTLAKKKL